MAKSKANNTLSITDNRTGKKYDLPIENDTIKVVAISLSVTTTTALVRSTGGLTVAVFLFVFEAARHIFLRSLVVNGFLGIRNQGDQVTLKPVFRRFRLFFDVTLGSFSFM